jgi:hypothetical protein
MRVMKSKSATLVALLVLAAFVSAGCGSSSSSSSASSTSSGSAASTQSAATSTRSTGGVKLAKTKFVIHTGLAFGAFHRYIYKPFKAGTFTGGNLTHNKAAVVKAGLAGLFAYHELKIALKDAQANPTLSKLVAPITALQAKLHSVGSGLKSGNVDPSAIESSNGDVTNLSSAASAAGQKITEAIPSAGQLLSGG